MKHRQPDPDDGHPDFVTEPLWTQFLPLSATSQYLLFWYAAETVPPEVERTYVVPGSNNSPQASPPNYRPPPSFPEDLTLEDRIGMDKTIRDNGQQTMYEPVHIHGTAQDDEERMYESHLLTIADARRKLRGSVMEDVVRRGWEAIQLRMTMEEKNNAAAS